MNFKDLEKVKGGTVLLDAIAYGRFFVGFSANRERIITTCCEEGAGLACWTEEEIRSWRFKTPPCRSKKRVIEGWVDLSKTFCDTTGYYNRVYKLKTFSTDKVTLTIEEPERQATITESDLEKALDDCGFLPSNRNRDMLKEKLFGGENE